MSIYVLIGWVVVERRKVNKFSPQGTLNLGSHEPCPILFQPYAWQDLGIPQDASSSPIR